MKGKVQILSCMLTLALISSVLTSSAFQGTAKDPELVNWKHKDQEHSDKKKRKANFWVHRRDPAEKDPSQATAVAIHLMKERGGASEERSVVGTITRFTNYASGKYTERQTAIIVKGTTSEPSEPSGRKMETLTLVVKNGTEAGTKVGYLTYYKGKTKGKSPQNRANTRAIFRWDSDYVKQFETNAAQQMKTMRLSGPCDVPPDDDPMEEEDLTYEEISALPIPEEDIPDPEMP